MKPTAVSTKEAPQAIGPYAQAVTYGDLVFCSGQVALDPQSGGLVGAGDVRVETRQAMTNLSAVLEAAGSHLERVLKTTIYVVDMGDFAAVNEEYANFFRDHLPARATIAVCALPKGARVEIEAVAAVG